MDFTISFSLAIIFNLLLITKGWYHYRISNEEITLFDFLKKILAADIGGIISLFNFKLIKGHHVLNFLTIIVLTLLCFLMIDNFVAYSS
jgi:hypothetical protein